MLYSLKDRDLGYSINTFANQSLNDINVFFKEGGLYKVNVSDSGINKLNLEDNTSSLLFTTNYNSPTGADYSSTNDEIYVIENPSSPQVTTYSSDGSSELSSFATPDGALGDITTKDSRIFIGNSLTYDDTNPTKLYELDQSGNIVNFTDPGVSVDGLTFINGLLLLASNDSYGDAGKIYVYDADTFNQLGEFNSDFTPSIPGLAFGRGRIWHIGLNSTDFVQEIHEINSEAVGRDADIFTIDYNNSNIKKFNQFGKQMLSQNYTLGPGNYPSGIVSYGDYVSYVTTLSQETIVDIIIRDSKDLNTVATTDESSHLYDEEPPKTFNFTNTNTHQLMTRIYKNDSTDNRWSAQHHHSKDFLPDPSYGVYDQKYHINNFYGTTPEELFPVTSDKQGFLYQQVDNTVHKFTEDDTEVDSFNLPSSINNLSTSWTDIAYEQPGYLWVLVQSDNMLYKVDLDSLNVVRDFSVSGDPYGIDVKQPYNQSLWIYDNQGDCQRVDFGTMQTLVNTNPGRISDEGFNYTGIAHDREHFYTGQGDPDARDRPMYREWDLNNDDTETFWDKSSNAVEQYLKILSLAYQPPNILWKFVESESDATWYLKYANTHLGRMPHHYDIVVDSSRVIDEVFIYNNTGKLEYSDFHLNGDNHTDLVYADIDNGKLFMSLDQIDTTYQKALIKLDINKIKSGDTSGLEIVKQIPYRTNSIMWNEYTREVYVVDSTNNEIKTFDKDLNLQSSRSISNYSSDASWVITHDLYRDESITEDNIELEIDVKNSRPVDFNNNMSIAVGQSVDESVYLDPYVINLSNSSTSTLSSSKDTKVNVTEGTPVEDNFYLEVDVDRNTVDNIHLVNRVNKTVDENFNIEIETNRTIDEDSDLKISTLIVSSPDSNSNLRSANIGNFANNLENYYSSESSEVAEVTVVSSTEDVLAQGTSVADILAMIHLE